MAITDHDVTVDAPKQAFDVGGTARLEGVGVTRREPKLRDTKERILAAALELFGRHGYNAVSITDICRRAGLTQGAFYYYFRDRKDVVADLQRELWTRLRAKAAAAYDPQADAVTNIKSTFHAFYASLRNFEEARFFLREAWSIPDVELAARAIVDEWVGLTARFLKRQMNAGEIVRVDPEALASVLIGAFSEATLFVLTTRRVDETNEVLDRVLESLRVTGQDRPANSRASGRPKTT